MSEIKTNKLRPRKGTTQTIGDSGDTVTVSSGANICNAGTLTVSNLTNSGTITSTGTLTTAGITGGTIDNQGTITGLQQVIEWDTTAKTANFNADVQSGYFVNTTSGAITVTFPASPTAGDVIAIKDYALTANTNNITIDPNGNKIQGLTVNFDITVEGTSAQFIYVDATRGWVLIDASKASDIAEDLKFVAATGGTITTSGNFKIHTFTSPGTFTVSCAGNDAGSNSVDYLVIAGGGGGGGGRPGSGVSAGGGGAGGYRESSGVASGCYTVSPLGACVSALPVSVTAYPITVGGGGAGRPNSLPINNPGGSGSNSIFSTITSSGGGGGGSRNTASPDSTQLGVTGGSGGGSSGVGGAAGAAGNTPPVSPPQGNSGGNGASGSPFVSGGGGGATATGNNGTPGNGNGGTGGTSSINATPTARAGGGGGGNGGTGGTGGGGPSTTAGTTNTGGGGGGANPGASSGGSGGSGIVIIRYKYQN